MSTQYHVADGIAVITLNNPPVNGLGHATRAGIVQDLQKAGDDAAVQAVVIIGGGKVFCGGADIREFGSPTAFAAPDLNTVIQTLERFNKPVVAAIHGVAMGGGLELALGCHYRIALAGTQLALPEVNIGIVPGAGGTQRLPRVVGVETALQMITSGASVPVEKLLHVQGQKLLSRVVEGTDAQALLAAATAFATSVATTRPLPTVRDLKVIPPADAGLFDKTRAELAKTKRRLMAPQSCVDCVEAATQLGLDEGLAYEGKVFEGLVTSGQAQALRHAFFGERAASKIPNIPENTQPRAIGQVAIIGAGTMGGGIAMSFLNANIPVKMLELKQEALDRGIGVMRNNYEAQVAKGKLAQNKYEARMALLTSTTDYQDIAQADLVIEAVFEEMSVKEAVFKQLDAVMKPGAILASNTSTLDVDAIARFTSRPQDVIGTHFFSPANVMRLLEVVRSQYTAPDVLVTIMQLAKKIKKVAVISGVCDGFIGNRMLEQYTRQAFFLVDEGATPEQVDKAIEGWGMAMGPFRVSDLAGNDISWYIRKRRYTEQPDLRYSRLADRLCELGRYGQKTSKGWYDYEAGKREPIVSAEVSALIEQYRKDQKITPRVISDDEIVGRLVYALVNEGAHILKEGIAARASDIDMVYLTGYGFPIWRGGPMLYADMQGLDHVVQAMRKYQSNPHDDANFWEPAPLLAELAASGQRFNP